MIGDKSLYREIGKWVYNPSPDDAIKLIMRANLSAESDVGTFEFDYVKSDGSTDWYDAGAKATTELTKLLISLRNSFIKEDQPAWKSCEFIVEIETGDFQFNVKY